MSKVAALLIMIIAASSLGRTTSHEVHMIGMSFVPKTITIRRGDKVKFVNDSKITHNAVFSFSRTPFLRQGESHEIKFENIGKHEYICEPHIQMNMRGFVIVQE